VQDDPTFRPSAAAYRRAAAAGRDLDELRRSEPQTFRLFSAEEACRTSTALLVDVGDAFFAAFPGRDLYQLPDAVPERVRLLAFPPLGRDEARSWEHVLAALAGRWPQLPVYFRVVEDVRGVQRELALPLPPEDWRGQSVVVGPFADRAGAEAFGRRATADGTLTFDAFALDERWVCDLFTADDAEPKAG
jgi:hypothetical protein